MYYKCDNYKIVSWEEVIKKLAAKNHRGVLGDYVRIFSGLSMFIRFLNFITCNLFLFSANIYSHTWFHISNVELYEFQAPHSLGSLY